MGMCISLSCKAAQTYFLQSVCVCVCVHASAREHNEDLIAAQWIKVKHWDHLMSTDKGMDKYNMEYYIYIYMEANEV